MCAYSYHVALILGTIAVPSKSPVLYVVELYCDHPIRYNRTSILPACTTVSEIWQRPTTLVYNMISVMYFEA